MHRSIPLLLSALCAGLLQAQPQVELLGETNPLAALTGNRFEGTWWTEQRGGSPVMIQLNRDGTALMQSALDTDPQLPFTLTPIQGIWRRSGPRSMETLGVRFTKNPEGATIGYEKVRATFAFGEDFNSLEGAYSLEIFACEDVPVPPNPGFFTTVPVCPNATGDAVGDAPPAAQDVPVRAFRLSIE